MRKSSRVLIADDHALFRQGIQALLRDTPDLQVVGEAASEDELLVKSRQLSPDVVLIDSGLPPVDGLEATRQLRLELPETRVVILSIRDDLPELVYSAIKAGALGFVTKTSGIGELTAAIRAVGSGQASIATGSLTSLVTVLGSSELMERERGETLEEALTEREEEVLELVTQGHSNREIALTLCISESTVRSHLHNILDKLHLSNRVQAATYALTFRRRRGVIRANSASGTASAGVARVPVSQTRSPAIRGGTALSSRSGALPTSYPRHRDASPTPRTRRAAETSLRA